MLQTDESAYVSEQTEKSIVEPGVYVTQEGIVEAAIEKLKSYPQAGVQTAIVFKMVQVFKEFPIEYD